METERVEDRGVNRKMLEALKAVRDELVLADMCGPLFEQVTAAISQAEYAPAKLMWVVSETSDSVHITPSTETHSLTKECWCGPRVEVYEKPLVIHKMRQ